MADTQRNLKDRLFCKLFGDKEQKELALELYNALNETNYTNPDDIQINTIEDVVYMGMRNDVSFLLAGDLNVYEQQSSWNPNMPLREFLYVAHLIEKYLNDTRKNRQILSQILVEIPAPKLVVLYNINEERHKVPVQDHVMKLSDCFINHAEGDLEARVHAYNINPGNWLPDRCVPLHDYSDFVEKYRRYVKDAATDEERIKAADASVRELPDGPVKRYIMSHRSEVIDVILTEYNEEEVMDSLKECYRTEGRAEGKQLTKDAYKRLAEVMKNSGYSSDDLVRVMLDETFCDEMMQKFGIS